jgi:ketosteroid isomerase-like protein
VRQRHAYRALRGKDGAREFWRQDRALFDEVQSEFKNVIAQDDRVALEWTRTGSARDGNPIEFEGGSLLELEEGRIRRFTAYFDPHEVGRQAA